MTGAELRATRKAAGYSRKTLAKATALHPDTVRYWERKQRLKLRRPAVKLMLSVLGLDEWRKQAVIEATTARMAAQDAIRGQVFTASLNSTPHGNEGYFAAHTRPCAHHGVSQKTDKLPVTTRKAQTCGAKTRAGHPCKSRVLWKSGRCKNHGGKSTGPRTPEGRARIAAAMRKRWADKRNETAQQATKELSQ